MLIKLLLLLFATNAFALGIKDKYVDETKNSKWESSSKSFKSSTKKSYFGARFKDNYIASFPTRRDDVWGNYGTISNNLVSYLKNQSFYFRAEVDFSAKCKAYLVNVKVYQGSVYSRLAEVIHDQTFTLRNPGKWKTITSDSIYSRDHKVSYRVTFAPKGCSSSKPEDREFKMTFFDMSSKVESLGSSDDAFGSMKMAKKAEEVALCLSTKKDDEGLIDATCLYLDNGKFFIKATSKENLFDTLPGGINPVILSRLKSYTEVGNQKDLFIKDQIVLIPSIKDVTKIAKLMDEYPLWYLRDLERCLGYFDRCESRGGKFTELLSWWEWMVNESLYDTCLEGKYSCLREAKDRLESQKKMKSKLKQYSNGSGGGSGGGDRPGGGGGGTGGGVGPDPEIRFCTTTVTTCSTVGSSTVCESKPWVRPCK
ncbi:hypothetical protein SAMN06296036_110183 [Pseudobacteriovorax antillogorgiicola]|uniref:Uncharacterized protein n=2 Tax=Pseudobacteriovorax antillogorgiicola TaxID=1513793 RepID=A0A1Y6BYQ5_9BACT|nr:hypothetical protein EDD56_13725 [Pseudobacteriovorax antillogorgiicola]SMF34949.1 hypothetical protein SAMN06296036_110183 [Pseudobacteriovorax antillogorgiicola]